MNLPVGVGRFVNRLISVSVVLSRTMTAPFESQSDTQTSEPSMLNSKCTAQPFVATGKHRSRAPVDLEMAFNKIAPEAWPYVHTCEGPDDMPAHIKASMLGNSLTIPVGNGRLCLGTWQGIYLCEHRNHATSRRLVLTLQGEWD